MNDSRYRIEAHAGEGDESDTWLLRCLTCVDHGETIGTDESGQRWMCYAGAVNRGQWTRLNEINQSARKHERLFHALPLSD